MPPTINKRVEEEGRKAADHQVVYHWYEEFTIAQVNAGADVLRALSRYRYRIVDMALIAIGGAAGTATSVDISGTQAAAAVKLLEALVAGLTQNTLLRAGATNANILAGGASFEKCDVNTPIRITKTGGALDTATHIGVSISYCIEL